MKCPAQIASGPNAGGICNKKAKPTGFCGRHDPTPKERVTFRYDLARVGERRCEQILRDGMKVGKQCAKTASFYADGYYCGTHSKYGMREKLRPKDKTQPPERPFEPVVAASRANAIADRGSSVILHRIHPFIASDVYEDFCTVFPDTKHGTRLYSLPGLCPSRLGPIEHGYKGLPAACTLQIFTEYSSCYSSDLYGSGEIDVDFLTQMEEGFRTGKSRAKPDRKSKFVSMVGVDDTGKLVEIAVDRWRALYCSLYQRLAEVTDDYQRLVALQKERVNIAICGTKLVIGDTDSRVDYENYALPFDHEKTLHVMLTTKDRTTYPWLNEVQVS